MAHEESVKALEELEKAVDHVLALLTEADQDLEQAGKAIDDYNSAHDLNAAKGHTIADAIKGLQGLIGNYTGVHNQLAGQIKEAKEEAAQRPEHDESSESESESL